MFAPSWTGQTPAGHSKTATVRRIPASLTCDALNFEPTPKLPHDDKRRQHKRLLMGFTRLRVLFDESRSVDTNYPIPRSLANESQARRWCHVWAASSPAPPSSLTRLTPAQTHHTIAHKP
ncbi:hypothetical protein BD779DRAFT_1474339 [Infundibulicybe gibba]|nr:hypothetical protein BD779DRAFT_1474339 [Infundibulicybe gibba]